MSEYLTNQFQGQVRPIRKQKSSPPIWQEELRIGELDTPNSHLWTTFRLYIRPATLQYPQAGLFLSFGNGERFAFSRLNSGDLNRLHEFLGEYGEVAENLYRDEIRKAIQVQEQIKTIDQLQQLTESGGGDQLGLEDIRQLIVQEQLKRQSTAKLGGTSETNVPPAEESTWTPTQQSVIPSTDKPGRKATKEKTEKAV